MLCKAAMMGDFGTFDAICAAAFPADAKALGRCVAPFDEARWQAVFAKSSDLNLTRFAAKRDSGQSCLLPMVPSYAFPARTE